MNVSQQQSSKTRIASGNNGRRDGAHSDVYKTGLLPQCSPITANVTGPNDRGRRPSYLKRPINDPSDLGKVWAPDAVGLILLYSSDSIQRSVTHCSAPVGNAHSALRTDETNARPFRQNATIYKLELWSENIRGEGRHEHALLWSLQSPYHSFVTDCSSAPGCQHVMSSPLEPNWNPINIPSISINVAISDCKRN